MLAIICVCVETCSVLPLLAVQLFESLNVAMQAMAAAYLGKHDRSSARAVLVRTLQISTALGVGLGLLLAAGSHQVVGLFTKDAAVAALACTIMPVIALFMPLDAAASITDGGLIAAGQTNALSVIQVLGTLVQYGVMAVLMKMGHDSVVYVWAVLKVMTLARLGGGLFIHFGSKRSAFKRDRHAPAAASAAAAAAAAAPAEGVPAVSDAEASSSAAAAAPAAAAADDTAAADTSSSNGHWRDDHHACSSSGSSSTGHALPGPLHQQQQQHVQETSQREREWQQVQPVLPQQHQIMMQHQQQQSQHRVPTISAATDLGQHQHE